MKALFFLANFYALTVFALPNQDQLRPIQCFGRGAAARFEPLRKWQTPRDSFGIYRASVDAHLSISYLGRITRDIRYDRVSSNADYIAISDWDGNSGIDLFIPRSALREQLTFSRFGSFLRVYADDIMFVEKKSYLTCHLE